MLKATAVVLLGILLLPATPFAQNRWTVETRARMRQAVSWAYERGWSLTSQYYTSTLASGTYHTVAINLDERDQMMVVGVCDGDCRDLDLVLLEEDGREITADRQDDATPVLHVPSGHPGRHLVKVVMDSCRVQPCRYEVGLFVR